MAHDALYTCTARAFAKNKPRQGLHAGWSHDMHTLDCTLVAPSDFAGWSPVSCGKSNTHDAQFSRGRQLLAPQFTEDQTLTLRVRFQNSCLCESYVNSHAPAAAHLPRVCNVLALYSVYVGCVLGV